MTDDAPTPSAWFLYRLLPPRPTFAVDLTPGEADVMQRHVAYWSGHLEHGTVAVFGPVADPAGSWGLGIVRARDGAHAEELARADPATASGVCTYQIVPMPGAIVRSAPG